MLFSIATATKNSLQALKKCVGSVRNQKGVSYEHIIKDALSNDGTAEWLSLQADLQWESSPDKGMYDAINTAWRKSKGEILSMLNADEQYLPDTLQHIARIFEQRTDIDAVFGDYIICDEETGKIIAARREIPLRSIYLKNGHLYAMTCTLFFRRKLLENGLLKFSNNYKIVADLELVASLLRNNVKFLHVPKYLSIFGVSKNNLSLNANAREEIRKWKTQNGHRVIIMQLFTKLMRISEKFANGCYRRTNVEYEFCTNEKGETKKIFVKKAPIFWEWEGKH